MVMTIVLVTWAIDVSLNMEASPHPSNTVRVVLGMGVMMSMYLVKMMREVPFMMLVVMVMV